MLWQISCSAGKKASHGLRHKHRRSTQLQDHGGQPLSLSGDQVSDFPSPREAFFTADQLVLQSAKDFQFPARPEGSENPYLAKWYYIDKEGKHKT